MGSFRDDKVSMTDAPEQHDWPANAALIGNTGFVGGTLLQALPFKSTFNSRNIDRIGEMAYPLVVCAGAPAAKWIANQDPAGDRASLGILMENLTKVEVEEFILISTVDVYPNPRSVTEDTPVVHNPEPYGQHRLELEEFVRDTFSTHRIVRLPALFGQGLKKNVLYDLLHKNQVERINAESAFQWFDMSQLSGHLLHLRSTPIRLVNLVPEPVSTKEILDRFFPDAHVPAGDRASAAEYNVETVWAHEFGGARRYIYSRDDTLRLMGRFIEQALADVHR